MRLRCSSASLPDRDQGRRGACSRIRFLRPTSLKLRNFKGVAELDFALDESLTLLAGVNGVGKTSVIQALVAALTHTWWRKPPHDYPRFGLPESVVRTGASGTEIVLEPTWSDRLPLFAGYSFRGRDLELDESHASRLSSHRTRSTSLHSCHSATRARRYGAKRGTSFHGARATEPIGEAAISSGCTRQAAVTAAAPRRNSR